MTAEASTKEKLETLIDTYANNTDLYRKYKTLYERHINSNDLNNDEINAINKDFTELYRKNLPDDYSKYCRKCNKMYVTDDEYCKECGTKLTTDTTPELKPKIKSGCLSSILRSIATLVLAICILSFILNCYMLYNTYDFENYIAVNKLVTITICATLSAIAIIVTSIEGNIRDMFEQQNELLTSYLEINKK